MRMYVGGEWVDKDDKIEVINSYNNSVIDTVPSADLEDLETAIASAARGAKVMAEIPAYDRYLMLRKTAEIMEARHEDFGRTITLEEGKIIAEGRLEASRAIQTMTLSAEEAKRLYGETIPLDGAPGWDGQLGFTLRVPCGIVAAISPFNFPLNLVCHKVGPALAAGNAVIIKPASDTPLSALKLTEALLEAGVPAEAVQCVTGSGGKIGDNLRAALDHLPLSRQLATIHTDVELAFGIEEVDPQPEDREALLELFKEYEFKTWIAEYAGDKASDDSQAVDAPAQAAPERQYETILTEDQLDDWLARLEKAELFAFDTETTSLRYSEAEIVGVSFAIEPGKAALPPPGPRLRGRAGAAGPGGHPEQAQASAGEPGP